MVLLYDTSIPLSTSFGKNQLTDTFNLRESLIIWGSLNTGIRANFGIDLCLIRQDIPLIIVGFTLISSSAKLVILECITLALWGKYSNYNKVLS
jgi:hypothetical protein